MDKLQTDHIYCVLRTIRKQKRLLTLRLVTKSWYQAVNRIFVERQWCMKLSHCGLLHLGRLEWVRYLDITDTAEMLPTLKDWPLTRLKMDAIRSPASGILLRCRLSTITRLEIVRNDSDYDRVYENELSMFPRLEHLSVRGVDEWDRSQNDCRMMEKYKIVGECTTLRSLNVRWNLTAECGATDERINIFERERYPMWKTLTRLSCLDISISMVRILQNLQMLDLLYIRDPKIVDHLRYLTGLRDLSIRGPMTCSDVTSFPSLLTRLSVDMHHDIQNFTSSDYSSSNTIRVELGQLKELELYYCGGAILDTPILKKLKCDNWVNLPTGALIRVEELSLCNRSDIADEVCYDLRSCKGLWKFKLINCRRCNFILPRLHNVLICDSPMLPLPQTDILYYDPSVGVREISPITILQTDCYKLTFTIYTGYEVDIGYHMPSLYYLKIRSFEKVKRIVLPLGVRKLSTNRIPDNLEEMIGNGLQIIVLKRCPSCMGSGRFGGCGQCPQLVRADVKVVYHHKNVPYSPQ